MSDKKVILSPLISLFGWAALIFYLCSAEIDPPGDPSWWDFDGLDKLVHAGLFTVMAFLANWTFYRRSGSAHFRRYAPWYSLLVCILYGGLIELLQGAVFTWRSADWNDWLFDIGGALLGLLLFHFVKKRYLK